jgi:hypothetical protein
MSYNLILKSVALLVLGVGVNGGIAAAQVSVGIQTDWGSDTGVGVGFQTVFDLGAIVKGLETVGSFHYFFPGTRHGAQATYRELNTNLVYRIDIADQPVTPYVGSGFNVSYTKASVRVLDIDASGSEILNGLNVLCGLMFDVGRFRPFVEGRLTTGGGRQFVASAGLRF